jgi:hypothetical protein
MVDIFDKYSNKRDKMKSLYTVVTHNISLQEISDEIDHKLKLAKTIKYPKKRAHVNNRLYAFKTYLKENRADSNCRNSIFFVSDTVDEVTLTKDWLKVLQDFDVDKFIFCFNEYFEIEYLKNLLTDVSYKEVICIKNNTLKHIHLNPTKKKVFREIECKSLDVEEYLKTHNVTDKCIIHGVSVALKNLSLNNHHVFTRMLTDEEITNIFKTDKISAVHKKFDDHIAYMNHEKTIHRIVFSKEIEKCIKNMQLSTIYCTPDIFERIRQKVPHELLNFDLVLVESLQVGDSGDKLKNTYGGVVGVTYY